MKSEPRKNRKTAGAYGGTTVQYDGVIGNTCGRPPDKTHKTTRHTKARSTY